MAALPHGPENKRTGPPAMLEFGLKIVPTFTDSAA